MTEMGGKKRGKGENVRGTRYHSRRSVGPHSVMKGIRIYCLEWSQENRCIRVERKYGGMVTWQHDKRDGTHRSTDCFAFGKLPKDAPSGKGQYFNKTPARPKRTSEWWATPLLSLFSFQKNPNSGPPPERRCCGLKRWPGGPSLWGELRGHMVAVFFRWCSAPRESGRNGERVAPEGRRGIGRAGGSVSWSLSSGRGSTSWWAEREGPRSRRPLGRWVGGESGRGGPVGGADGEGGGVGVRWGGGWGVSYSWLNEMVDAAHDPKHQTCQTDKPFGT